MVDQKGTLGISMRPMSKTSTRNNIGPTISATMMIIKRKGNRLDNPKRSILLLLAEQLLKSQRKNKKIQKIRRIAHFR